MIKRLTITNFRCYKNSTIFFEGTSILVGRNNAGKSTLIEALKIISVITRKYKTLRFVAPPDWIKECVDFGVSPAVENMNISDRGIFYMYGEEPAVVEAQFVNGTSIKAYVGEGLSIFANIYDSEGCPARNSKELKLIEIPTIEVLPQISAVLDAEKVIKKATVDHNKSTRLASRNFRNQLFYYEDAFPMFKSLVESTWENIKVSPIESIFENDGQLLQFFVRVKNFEAEIGWMGHGLQMWIQTMWFVSQCGKDSIVVLDEPDVYMHADLQRRLIRLITPMFPQLIIATHSLEIIEEVTSDCIIPIDSSKTEIKPIGEASSLQFISKNLGSSFNIDLARLFISNKFLVLDGDDTSRRILSAFQSVLFPQDLHPIINLPKTFINGWNDWEKVKVLSGLFESNDIPVNLFCLFKSGYKSQEEIARRKKEAKQNKIGVHILSKKEIENYAINENAILRYILNKKHRGDLSLEKLNSVMSGIKSEMKDDIINYSISNLREEVLDVQKAYQSLDADDIISGREFFNILSLWTQEKFGITISARQVIPYFNAEEIDIEIKNIISRFIDN